MNQKIWGGIFLTIIAVAGLIVYAADHSDAPAVTGGTADIADYYCFQSQQDPDKLVFVCNLQGGLTPSQTAGAAFDANVMVEFNIDNTGDNVEDLVIQCMFDDSKVWTYGPVTPSSTGKVSKVETSGSLVEANLTAYGSVSPVVGESGGIKIFAGPHDDPFFFDLDRYNEIDAGNATQFNNPGVDAFAGTNVMSVAVEIPKSMLGAVELNTWVETKRKS